MQMCWICLGKGMIINMLLLVIEFLTDERINLDREIRVIKIHKNKSFR